MPVASGGSSVTNKASSSNRKISTLISSNEKSVGRAELQEFIKHRSRNRATEQKNKQLEEASKRSSIQTRLQELRQTTLELARRSAAHRRNDALEQQSSSNNPASRPVNKHSASVESLTAATESLDGTRITSSDAVNNSSVSSAKSPNVLLDKKQASLTAAELTENIARQPEVGALVPVNNEINEVDLVRSSNFSSPSASVIAHQLAINNASVADEVLRSSLNSLKLSTGGNVAENVISTTAIAVSNNFSSSNDEDDKHFANSKLFSSAATELLVNVATVDGGGGDGFYTQAAASVDTPAGRLVAKNSLSDSMPFKADIESMNAVRQFNNDLTQNAMQMLNNAVDEHQRRRQLLQTLKAISLAKRTSAADAESKTDNNATNAAKTYRVQVRLPNGGMDDGNGYTLHITRAHSKKPCTPSETNNHSVSNHHQSARLEKSAGGVPNPALQTDGIYSARAESYSHTPSRSTFRRKQTLSSVADNNNNSYDDMQPSSKFAVSPTMLSEITSSLLYAEIQPSAAVRQADPYNFRDTCRRFLARNSAHADVSSQKSLHANVYDYSATNAASKRTVNIGENAKFLPKPVLPTTATKRFADVDDDDDYVPSVKTLPTQPIEIEPSTESVVVRSRNNDDFHADAESQLPLPTTALVLDRNKPDAATLENNDKTNFSELFARLEGKLALLENKLSTTATIQQYEYRPLSSSNVATQSINEMPQIDLLPTNRASQTDAVQEPEKPTLFHSSDGNQLVTTPVAPTQFSLVKEDFSAHNAKVDESVQVVQIDRRTVADESSQTALIIDDAEPILTKSQLTSPNCAGKQRNKNRLRSSRVFGIRRALARSSPAAEETDDFVIADGDDDLAAPAANLGKHPTKDDFVDAVVEEAVQPVLRTEDHNVLSRKITVADNVIATMPDETFFNEATAADSTLSIGYIEWPDSSAETSKIINVDAAAVEFVKRDASVYLANFADDNALLYTGSVPAIDTTSTSWPSQFTSMFEFSLKTTEETAVVDDIIDDTAQSDAESGKKALPAKSLQDKDEETESIRDETSDLSSEANDSANLNNVDFGRPVDAESVAAADDDDDAKTYTNDDEAASAVDSVSEHISTDNNSNVSDDDVTSSASTKRELNVDLAVSDGDEQHIMADNSRVADFDDSKQVSSVSGGDHQSDDDDAAVSDNASSKTVDIDIEEEYSDEPATEVEEEIEVSDRAIESVPSSITVYNTPSAKNAPTKVEDNVSDAAQILSTAAVDSEAKAVGAETLQSDVSEGAVDDDNLERTADDESAKLINIDEFAVLLNEHSEKFVSELDIALPLIKVANQTVTENTADADTARRASELIDDILFQAAEKSSAVSEQGSQEELKSDAENGTNRRLQQVPINSNWDVESDIEEPSTEPLDDSAKFFSADAAADAATYDAAHFVIADSDDVNQAGRIENILFSDLIVGDNDDKQTKPVDTESVAVIIDDFAVETHTNNLELVDVAEQPTDADGKLSLDSDAADRTNDDILIRDNALDEVSPISERISEHDDDETNTDAGDDDDESSRWLKQVPSKTFSDTESDIVEDAAVPSVAPETVVADTATAAHVAVIDNEKSADRPYALPPLSGNAARASSFSTKNHKPFSMFSQDFFDDDDDENSQSSKVIHGQAKYISQSSEVIHGQAKYIFGKTGIFPSNDDEESESIVTRTTEVTAVVDKTPAAAAVQQPVETADYESDFEVQIDDDIDDDAVSSDREKTEHEIDHEKSMLQNDADSSNMELATITADDEPSPPTTASAVKPELKSVHEFSQSLSDIFKTFEQRAAAIAAASTATPSLSRALDADVAAAGSVTTDASPVKNELNAERSSTSDDHEVESPSAVTYKPVVTSAKKDSPHTQDAVDDDIVEELDDDEDADENNSDAASENDDETTSELMLSAFRPIPPGYGGWKEETTRDDDEIEKRRREEMLMEITRVSPIPMAVEEEAVVPNEHQNETSSLPSERVGDDSFNLDSILMEISGAEAPTDTDAIDNVLLVTEIGNEKEENLTDLAPQSAAATPPTSTGIITVDGELNFDWDEILPKQKQQQPNVPRIVESTKLPALPQGAGADSLSIITPVNKSSDAETDAERPQIEEMTLSSQLKLIDSLMPELINNTFDKIWNGQVHNVIEDIVAPLQWTDEFRTFSIIDDAASMRKNLADLLIGLMKDHLQQYRLPAGQQQSKIVKHDEEEGASRFRLPFPRQRHYFEQAFHKYVHNNTALLVKSSSKRSFDATPKNNVTQNSTAASSGETAAEVDIAKFWRSRVSNLVDREVVSRDRTDFIDPFVHEHVHKQALLDELVQKLLFTDSAEQRDEI